MRLATLLALLLSFPVLADVHFKKIVLSDQFFSEGANAADFNGDGKTDVVAGPFWYEGPDFSHRHRYCAVSERALDPHGYSKHFFAFTDDVNHDGRTDIIVIGFPGEAASWYENPGGGPDQLWREHPILDHVDDESPTYADLTGDGVSELICIHATQFGYASRDPKALDQPWTFHPISPKNPAYQKFTHGLGVGDVNGDGRADLIDKDGWWEQPEKLDGDPMWTRHGFHFADAGAQMYALDVNGDHRADVITSLQAHGYGLAWHEQNADGGFEKHSILGATPAENPQGVCFSQLHAVAIADINGDGLPDIVTGKRYWAHGPEHDPAPNDPAVLYWFEAHKNPTAPGGVEFIPHQIDDNSGVGTQVVVADVNGDKRPDIVVGNKKGAFVFLQDDAPTTQSASQGDPFSQNVRPTDALPPDEERVALHVPPGFEVQLVASEPDISKPLNMAFDARGRLWVTETVEYPFPARDRPGRDKIKIIEIGKDGHAAKITTFAENLNIPIGLYPYRDGCIAFSIPEIHRYFDDDGDSHADRNEKLYGTFGDNDTHGMTSAFRRGLDGWLYACHGFNNVSTITASDGSSITLSSGNTYRMKVDGSHVEQFTWGQTNPYGMYFDPLGNMYTADSHSKPIYQLIRGGYYEGINKTDDGLGLAPMMMQHSHGSTAIAGVLYCESDPFPAEMRGHMLVGNVVTGRINQDSITHAGSSPIAHEEPDFLHSDDPWFRPVDMQIGPDGALYVADFYNKIIGHYEVPLDHPQRDHVRGRIWRISYHGAEYPMPDLRQADVDALIHALADSNPTVRRLATDELSDRVGAACVEPIRKLLADQKATPIQTVHALWVLHRLGSLDEQMIANAASASDPMIQTHAMRILSETREWPASYRQIAINALHADDALVRRCAADALAMRPAIENVQPLLALLQSTSSDDFQLRYQARVALRDQLRDERVFAKVLEAKYSDDELRQLLDISPAVSSKPASTFEISHLDLLVSDRAAVTKLLHHAIKFASDEQVVDSAIAMIRKVLADDLELQLQLFAEMNQMPEQSATCREWGRDIATRGIRSGQSSFKSWHTDEGPGNPWRVQRRASGDGNNDASFWSSVPAGESLTGVLRSEPFTIPAKLSFFIAGHNGYPGNNPPPKNMLRLRSASDGHIIRETLPPRQDKAKKVTWDLADVAGQRGYIEAIDGDKGNAYAWMAFGRLNPEVVPMPSDVSMVTAFDIARTLKLTELADDIAAMCAAAPDVNTRASGLLALAAFDRGGTGQPLGNLLVSEDTPIETREKIARELAKIDSPAARQTLVNSLRQSSRRMQVTMGQALCSTRPGGEALLASAAGQAPARLLQEKTIVDALRAAEVQDADARIAALTKNLPSPRTEIAALLEKRAAAFAQAKSQKAPNIERGRKVFATNCTACHQLDGVGRQIGPQLEGIGARGVDRVIEDVLDPSRNVDPAFRYSTLMLKGGDVVTGLFRREEPAGVLIFVDATGKEIPIEQSKIQRRVDSNASLMPDNFGTAIPEKDFNDLVDYLLIHRATKAK